MPNILSVFCLILCLPVLVARAETAPPAGPLDKVRLQLKWLHQFQFAGFYAALAQGYYREAGLDVEILPAHADQSAVDVVLAGGAEYGLHGSDLVVEHARGKPVVALAAIFQHSPMVFLARRDRGIDTLHDLAGRRLLLGPDAAELAAYLKSEGVPFQLALKHQSFDLKALMDGSVDAMPAYSTDEPYLLDQAGIAYSQFSPRAAGIDFYGDVLFTTAEELRRHPERARRFVEASLRGWYYALSHRDEIARLIHTRYGERHSLEHLHYEAEQMRRLMTPELVEIGHSNPGRWRHIADTYAELGMMPANHDLQGFLYERSPREPDRTRLYVVAGLVLTAFLLVGGVAFYFSRLNRALRREVDERQRLQEDLERLANTDALTGLPNRRAFLARLEAELARHQRYGHPLSLLMLDLDHFKQINDRCGHAGGDEALKVFAGSVGSCLRNQDLAGRLGGEEFAVLLPETAEDVALVVADRIRMRLEVDSRAAAEGRCGVTTSVGASAARIDDSVQSLMHRADRALYAAKQAGRNRVVASSALPPEARAD